LSLSKQNRSRAIELWNFICKDSLAPTVLPDSYPKILSEKGAVSDKVSEEDSGQQTLTTEAVSAISEGCSGLKQSDVPTNEWKSVLPSEVSLTPILSAPVIAPEAVISIGFSSSRQASRTSMAALVCSSEGRFSSDLPQEPHIRTTPIIYEYRIDIFRNELA
jgi:hypothetical protein